MLAALRRSLPRWRCLPVLRAQPAGAGPQPKPEMMENCPGLVAQPACRGVAARSSLKSDEVRITYVGHSTFLIESPRGMKIATDYNDYVKPRVLPDIVTMNYAHSTHYTDNPEPGIKHVLRGWGSSPDKPARHDLKAGDVRVRNVPTNIRSYVSGGTERHGNSIFIFEIANMCIAHLGHLHHTLNQQQLNEIGRVDVVHGAGRRRRHARPRGHDRGAAGAEGAADDPDALLQHVFAARLPRTRLRREVVRGRVPRRRLDRGVEDHAAGQADGAGAARPPF